MVGDVSSRPDVEAAERASWWTTGQIATAIGVSPVVLRAWDSRYGLGPARRGPGGQRLYGPRELQRLRRMSSLIDQGIRAREAAGLVLAEAVTPAGSLSRVEQLDQAAAEVDLPALADLLDELLFSHGTIVAWTDVLAPVLHRQGRRWQQGENAFEAEWAFSVAITAALDRHQPPLPRRSEGAPVLLACCGSERHVLPFRILVAVLREAGIPVVFLGEMVPGEVVARTAARLRPALVLLWSMTPYTADVPLLSELTRREFVVRAAGPGWYSAGGRVGPVVNGLHVALQLAAGRTGRSWP
ncbi:MerR family transcriptional regulator [Amycolatopsis sp. NPDC004378]